jgi:murein DD-endopeptidase MepM/ murein hydrolase activator NlpD
VSRLGFGLAAVLLVPAVLLMVPLLVMNPAVLSAAACSAAALRMVAGVPEQLFATTASGSAVVMDRAQLTHARTIIEVGAGLDGVGRDGVVVALMAALTESRLRMLANQSAYPESTAFPNDGDGGDHDSLGLFQMRPQSGWGTVAELMSPVYQARAFFGGMNGPNYPSPRGLLDIAGWQTMSKGQAAQRVEVSAFPDRYAEWEPVAQTIVAALTLPAGTGTPGGVPAAGEIPPTTRIVIPVPAGSARVSSPFGMREDPFAPGSRRMHEGTDWAAAEGSPILAAADGLVVWAGWHQGYSNVVAIEHNIAGQKVVTLYLHMWDSGIHVRVGDRVSAGQHIADVGNEGHSAGAHLHFEVHPGGWDAPPVDAEAWLAEHAAEGVTDPSTSVRRCVA